MRARLERSVEVAVPASVLWDFVTDWPRQGEWIPNTVVERVDAADALGGSFRAWTGLGRPAAPPRGGRGVLGGVSLRGVGFWDPMTITTWRREVDGGGRCEVLHLGRVVRGEGEFTVVAVGERRSRFVWAEVVRLPLGRLGAAAWPLAHPVLSGLVDRGLQTMRHRVEAGP